MEKLLHGTMKGFQASAYLHTYINLHARTCALSTHSARWCKIFFLLNFYMHLHFKYIPISSVNAGQTIHKQCV
jgi:hypothetical protein